MQDAARMAQVETKTAYRSLRDFMVTLEAEGELRRIKVEVDANKEIPAIVWETNEKRGPALLFERVKGFHCPVLVNAHGSLGRIALALGFPKQTSFRELRNHYAAILRNKTKWPTPELVNDAPCQEVVLMGEKANLDDYPIIHWHPQDGGRYITLNATVTKDPKFGRNIGMYRVNVVGPRKTGIMALQMQDIGIHAALAKQRGETKLPVAVVCGCDPAIMLSATTKCSHVSDDEFALAGAIRGEATQIVKCKTIPVDVPANCEFVVEGWLDLAQPMPEGPFGEWMGYYEEMMRTPTFEVTCITHRRDMIYQTLSVPHMYGENEWIRTIPLQSNFYNELKERVIGFRDCYIVLEGRGYKVVISIVKRYPGWAKQAIYAAVGTGYGTASVNQFTVVDSDVNIFDPVQVLFAEATRVDPQRDVVIFPPMGVYPLNPAARDRVDDPRTGMTEFAICSKMGVDATRKTALEGRKTSDLAMPAPENLEAVRRRWKEYGL